MKKETRENLQVGSALGMLALGMALTVAGFIVSPLGEIHESVLGLFAECLIYAGSIFGVAIYAHKQQVRRDKDVRGEENVCFAELGVRSFEF